MNYKGPHSDGLKQVHGRVTPFACGWLTHLLTYLRSRLWLNHEPIRNRSGAAALGCLHLRSLNLGLKAVRPFFVQAKTCMFYCYLTGRMQHVSRPENETRDPET